MTSPLLLKTLLFLHSPTPTVALTVGQGGYYHSKVGTLRLRQSKALVLLKTAEECGQD